MTLTDTYVVTTGYSIEHYAELYGVPPVFRTLITSVKISSWDLMDPIRHTYEFLDDNGRVLWTKHIVADELDEPEEDEDYDDDDDD